MKDSVVQTEPVRLAALVRSLILIGSTFGLLGLSKEDATFLGAQLDVLIPVLLPVLIAIVEWTSAHWVRSKVSSPETSELLANTVKDIETSRGKGAPIKVPLASLRAAERVLGTPEHPVRWIGDVEP